MATLKEYQILALSNGIKLSDYLLYIIANATGVDILGVLNSILSLLMDIDTKVNDTNNILQTTNPLLNFLPQLIDGNTDINFADTSVTADKTVYTVTGGKYFYLSDLTFSFTATVVGNILIRDGAGGTIMDSFSFPIATSSFIRSYKKPKRFGTSVYFDYVSGTLTTGQLIGTGIEKLQ